MWIAPNLPDLSMRVVEVQIAFLGVAGPIVAAGGLILMALAVAGVIRILAEGLRGGIAKQWW